MPKVKGSQIKDESITGTQIEDDTLTGDDIDESTLVMTLNDVLSDGASTTLTINSGNVIPSADNTYNLGSVDKVWSNIYSTNIFVQNLDINQAFSFPTTDGSSGQVLKTNGSGTLTWQNEGGGGGGSSPAGSDEQIQYNNQGSFGASSNLTYSSVNNQVTLTGTSKQCDTAYSTSAQKLRSFTYRRHYSINNLTANTWSTIFSFRPYISGTTTDPGANTFWTGVGMKVEICGHTSGSGNGYRSSTGHVEYGGSSASSATSSEITLGSCVALRFNLTGWVTEFQLNPNQPNASRFDGTVYVEIYFPRGAGGNGNNIEWHIT